MNVKKVLILVLWIVFLFSSCEMSFPRGGTAWSAETGSCLIEMPARLEATVSFLDGEIFYLQITIVGGLPAYLYPKPGRFDLKKLQGELGKNILYAFKYNERECLGSKYDEILSILVFTPEGPRDIIERFFVKKANTGAGSK